MSDYLSPIPVFFLTVAAGHEFEFFLAPRKDVASEKAQQDLKTGLDLLKTALEKLGAGGKTAVGYGAFKESIEAQQRRERTRNENQQRINEEACNAGIEADITAKGYKGLVAKLYRQAQKEHWETDNAKFYQVEQEYLPDISRETDAVIKKAAITLIWEMLEKKFPNIMADPDRMEGRKKDKFAYKNEKARNIAKALRKLNGIK